MKARVKKIGKEFIVEAFHGCQSFRFAYDPENEAAAQWYANMFEIALAKHDKARDKTQKAEPDDR